MRDKAAYTRTKDTMIQLDQQIREVAMEGEGSQRVVPVEIKRGELYVENGNINWQLKTNAKIIEPRTKINMGNLVISSNIDVKAHDYGTHYMLENSYLAVNITKFVNTSGSTQDIINSIRFKETNAVVDGNFTFMMGADNATSMGIMDSQLIPYGNNTNLEFGKVIVKVDSTSVYYELELGLESQADFITAKIRNVKG